MSERMSEVPETGEANQPEAKAKLARGMSTVKTKKGLRLSCADGGDITVDDLDGDNVVMTQEEFNSMVRNISVKGERVQSLRRYLGVAALLIFILGVVSFAMSWLAAEASKESHVEGAALVNTQGEPVRVASSDFKVNDDGTLVKQCHGLGENSCNSRRLSSTDEMPVTTTPTKHRLVLTSSMSDAYLMSLTEVVVFSDKGHTLRISVHGFARLPVSNSRCGNIVHFYTAWNGRVTLDSQELSFDASTEEAFLNAGFSLAVGGVSGRRLTSQHNVEGFFTAVAGMEESEGWDCHDVPLPELPEYFSQTLTIYQACAVAGVTGSALDACDSEYGGVVPGVHALPEQHQHAIMSKTARIKAQLSVDVPVEQTLFVKTEVEVLKTPGYQIQRTWMPNHPGQIQVSVYDRGEKESVEFQLLADFVPDGRFYCNSSAGDVTFQRSEQEAAESGVDISWHFEFLGLSEEAGLMYRHFRMMPTDAFLTWMESMTPIERPSDAYYEYWDSAETLAPYRLLTPDGSVIVWEAMTQGADDGAAETLLEDMGWRTAWDSILTCGQTEQDEGDPQVYTNGFLLPKMASPMMDLSTTSLEFYVLMIGGHEEIEWVENTTASNAGWDSLDSIIYAEGELADFAEYARRSVNPLAMPDVCKNFCPDVVATVTTAALDPANQDFCGTPGLSLLHGCVFQESTATAGCGKSPLAMSLSECEENGAFGGRRLSESDEINEEDDFEEDEEDNMKVTTIASGALVQAADPQPSMPVLSKLDDGSNSLDLADLDDGTRAELARILDLKSPPTTGRILFNSTVPKPGDAVKNVQGLVDMPGIDSPATSRRLFISMICLFPNVGPGCIFSIWVPKSGPSCDPISGSPPCKYSLAVKIQLTGPAAGALSIGGGGCIEAWMFSVPPPFDGSVCVAGSITAGFGRACGNKFPFTLGGYVSITAAVGLSFGVFSLTAVSVSVGVGVGISNYATQCWTNRRRRRWWGGGTRHCNYACDLRVHGDGKLNVGPGRLWARVEYWVSHRSFQMHLGADVCAPWPISSCWNIISVRVI